MTPVQRQQVLNPLVRLAVCMRAHGLASFPDPPGVWRPGTRIAIIPSSADVNSLRFKAAFTRCRPLLHEGPMHGGP